MKKSFYFLTVLLLMSGWSVAQSGFVKVKNNQFILNGQPYYFVGTNYWYGGLLPLVKDPVRGKERLIKELDFLQKRN